MREISDQIHTYCLKHRITYEQYVSDMTHQMFSTLA